MNDKHTAHTHTMKFYILNDTNTMIHVHKRQYNTESAISQDYSMTHC